MSDSGFEIKSSLALFWLARIGSISQLIDEWAPGRFAKNASTKFDKEWTHANYNDSDIRSGVIKVFSRSAFQLDLYLERLYPPLNAAPSS